MARRFRYNTAAASELEQAALWYDTQRVGLGAELIEAVDAKLDRILEAPRRWPLLHGTRRALVGRFPYALVYRELPDGEIEIVAVAHAKRRPRYWGRR